MCSLSSCFSCCTFSLGSHPAAGQTIAVQPKYDTQLSSDNTTAAASSSGSSATSGGNVQRIAAATQQVSLVTLSSPASASLQSPAVMDLKQRAAQSLNGTQISKVSIAAASPSDSSAVSGGNVQSIAAATQQVSLVTLPSSHSASSQPLPGVEFRQQVIFRRVSLYPPSTPTHMISTRRPSDTPAPFVRQLNSKTKLASPTKAVLSPSLSPSNSAASSDASSSNGSTSPLCQALQPRQDPITLNELIRLQMLTPKHETLVTSQQPDSAAASAGASVILKDTQPAIITHSSATSSEGPKGNINENQETLVESQFSAALDSHRKELVQGKKKKRHERLPIESLNLGTLHPDQTSANSSSRDDSVLCRSQLRESLSRREKGDKTDAPANASARGVHDSSSSATVSGEAISARAPETKTKILTIENTESTKD